MRVLSFWSDKNITTAPDAVKPARLLWPALLLLCAMLKVWLVAGVELGKDEAAYWYWGQHLDASYALLPFGVLRLAHWFYPGQEWFLRLPWVLGGALSTVLVYGLCRLHGNAPWLCLWAAAAFASSHWIWHTSSYLHPDGFLVACWLLALCLARGSLRRQDSSLHLLAGLAAGLAVLSKYSGAFLVAGLGLWIWCTQSPQRRWRLLAAFVVPALLVASPLAHAQLQATFHLPRALGTLSQIEGVANPLSRLLFFLVNPLFFVSPFLLYLLYRGAVAAVRDLWRWRAAERFLAVLPALFTIATFLFFALYRGQIKGNWILPAFLGLWPIAFSPRCLPARPRLLLTLIVATGLLQSLAIGLGLKYPALLSALTGQSKALDATYVGLVSEQDRQHEPAYAWSERLCEYSGWSAFADEVEKQLKEKEVPTRAPLASTQYGISFALAYYGNQDRICYTVDDPRFCFLADFHHQAGPPYPPLLLFAARAGTALPSSLLAHYPKSEPLGQVQRTAPGCAPMPYQLFALGF